MIDHSRVMGGSAGPQEAAPTAAGAAVVLLHGFESRPLTGRPC